MVVNEDCESCVREGLECRRPDIDGRKIRWQKGKVTSESDTGSIGQQDGGLEGSGQGLTTMNREFDIDGTYLDSLFDLIMGKLHLAHKYFSSITQYVFLTLSRNRFVSINGDETHRRDYFPHLGACDGWTRSDVLLALYPRKSI